MTSSQELRPDLVASEAAAAASTTPGVAAEKCADAEAATIITCFDLFACGVCGDLLFEPITLSCCERSFCGGCLRTWIRTNVVSAGIPRCPGGCGEKVPFRLPRVSASLQTAMEKLIPEAVEQRARAEAEDQAEAAVREAGRTEQLGGFTPWQDVCAACPIILGGRVAVIIGTPGVLIGPHVDYTHVTVKFDHREDGSDLCVHVLAKDLKEHERPAGAESLLSEPPELPEGQNVQAVPAHFAAERDGEEVELARFAAADAADAAAKRNGEKAAAAAPARQCLAEEEEQHLDAQAGVAHAVAAAPSGARPPATPAAVAVASGGGDVSADEAAASGAPSLGNGCRCPWVRPHRVVPAEEVLSPAANELRRIAQGRATPRAERTPPLDTAGGVGGVEVAAAAVVAPAPGVVVVGARGVGLASGALSSDAGSGGAAGLADSPRPASIQVAPGGGGALPEAWAAGDVPPFSSFRNGGEQRPGDALLPLPNSLGGCVPPVGGATAAAVAGVTTAARAPTQPSAGSPAWTNGGRFVGGFPGGGAAAGAHGLQWCASATAAFWGTPPLDSEGELAAAAAAVGCEAPTPLGSNGRAGWTRRTPATVAATAVGGSGGGAWVWVEADAHGGATTWPTPRLTGRRLLEVEAVAPHFSLAEFGEAGAQLRSRRLAITVGGGADVVARGRRHTAVATLPHHAGSAASVSRFDSGRRHTVPTRPAFSPRDETTTGYNSSLRIATESSVYPPLGGMKASTFSGMNGYTMPMAPMAPRMIDPSAHVSAGSTSFRNNESSVQTSQAISPQSELHLGQRASEPGQGSGSQTAPNGAPSGLKVGDFIIDGGPFDPTLPQTKKQLTAKLGLSSDSVIEELKGFRGGLNEGVWFLSDPTRTPREELALKLVTAQRKHEAVPTEAEKFIALHREEPQIARDPVIAFPIGIFNLVGPNGSRQHDLIVMPKAPGESVSNSLAYMVGCGRLAEMNALFQRIGSLLRGFHDRHGERQHGDFTTANILYDAPSGTLTLIDASTIDCMVSSKGLCSTETDCQRFEKALSLLSRDYGDQFFTDAMHHFQAGYGSVCSMAGGGSGANGAQQRGAVATAPYFAPAQPVPRFSLSPMPPPPPLPWSST